MPCCVDAWYITAVAAKISGCFCNLSDLDSGAILNNVAIMILQ